MIENIRERALAAYRDQREIEELQHDRDLVEMSKRLRRKLQEQLQLETSLDDYDRGMVTVDGIRFGLVNDMGDELIAIEHRCEGCGYRNTRQIPTYGEGGWAEVGLWLIELESGLYCRNRNCEFYEFGDDPSIKNSEPTTGELQVSVSINGEIVWSGGAS